MNLQSIKDKNKYLELKAFLIAFGVFAVIMVPFTISYGGAFLYYGDFLSQQLPFNTMMQRAVHDGALNWSWGTDLGSGAIGSYSFYLLGSPFFWLMSIFPDNTAVYLIPWVLALKYGTAAATSCAFIKRYVRKPEAVLIGALLYAFSGFQMYNIFFNHFHDVTAFFPLLLIALEERVEKNRRGVFALAVALMACINYYFFFGEVIFCVIYFLVKYVFNKNYKLKLKPFLWLAAESVVGLMMSMVIMLPSLMSIIGNSRLDAHMFGLDILFYREPYKIAKLIFAMFVVPDTPANATLFIGTDMEFNSLGVYLPLFSMAGVIAYMKARKKDVFTKMLIVCAVIAMVPVLNAAFSAFSTSAYLRWFYMPILFMALMTAKCLETDAPELKNATKICLAIPVLFGIAGCLPSNNPGGVTEYGTHVNDPMSFAVQVGIAVLSAVVLLFIVYKMNRGDKEYWIKLVALTAFCCMAVNMPMLLINAASTQEAVRYKNCTLVTQKELENIIGDDESFFRTDCSQKSDNYCMIWGYPGIRCFNSTVSTSIMKFYPKLGVERSVTSRSEPSLYGIRGLTSVKYYFNEIIPGLSESAEIVQGFEKLAQTTSYEIYENKNYVPMGFCFENYISENDFESVQESNRHKLLTKALVLNSVQIEKYSSLMTEISEEKLEDLSIEAYNKECAELSATSCSEFTADKNGFTAVTDGGKDRLVFFSVPYDKGFTAYVDGEKTEIECVDYGLSAVAVSGGRHEIRFDYHTPGFALGGAVSAAGAAAVLCIFFIPMISEKLKSQKGGRIKKK